MVPPFFDFLQAFTIQDVADIFQLARPLSHLALLDASSPKGRAFGSPRKLHLFAKASPFEERLPPRRGKMSRSDKRGSVARRKP
jgi:hypothetical protein